MDMQDFDRYFQSILLNKTNGNVGLPIPAFSRSVAQTLLDRINAIQLYAHTYSFNLNFKYSEYELSDFLSFAYEEGLSGVDMHIDYGKLKGLRRKSVQELEQIRALSERLGLTINLEISHTTKQEINHAVQLAGRLGAKEIRIYIVHGGKLSAVKKKGIENLRHAARMAEDNDLIFLLESHEALKSHEFVEIVQEVGSPRIKLLFDFGNMINAYEEPLEALKIMAPYIHHVHIKGVSRVTDGNGYGHIGVLGGEDELPQEKMLFDLLMLGEKEPRVKVFALEQVVGYCSKAYRYSDEEQDPYIPRRTPSQTEPDEKISLEENLLRERKYACTQVSYVRGLLEKFKTLAEFRLSYPE